MHYLVTGIYLDKGCVHEQNIRPTSHNMQKVFTNYMSIAAPQRSLHDRLQDKQVFVFDWDGTILNSMNIKTMNFDHAFRATILSELNTKPVADIAEHYLTLSGRPRKQIFLEIISLLGLDVNPSSFERFSSAFEALNKEKLIYSETFLDAIQLLEKLIEHNLKIYISSSVPQQELSALVNIILPASLREQISSILGSEDRFSKGTDHLQWIINETGATRDQLLVIGDDLADYELSSLAGVDCILVDRTGKMAGSSIFSVNDLSLIKECL